jgi:hypothetical protein
MKTLAGVVTALLGFVSLPAVMVAFFHLLPLISDLFVLRRAGHYVPATFELEWARTEEDMGPEAVGTVGGKREVLSLTPFLPRRPTSLNDLQDLVADLERIDVFYDAGGSGTSFQGRRQRLVPVPEGGDLRQAMTRRVLRTLILYFCPAVLLTGLGLLIARLGRGTLGCWMFPSAFFLACLPLFALFVVAVEAFQ